MKGQSRTTAEGPGTTAATEHYLIGAVSMPPKARPSRGPSKIPGTPSAATNRCHPCGPHPRSLRPRPATMTLRTQDRGYRRLHGGPARHSDGDWSAGSGFVGRARRWDTGLGVEAGRADGLEAVGTAAQTGLAWTQYWSWPRPSIPGGAGRGRQLVLGGGSPRAAGGCPVAARRVFCSSRPTCCSVVLVASLSWTHA